jgi:hypothetical protein
MEETSGQRREATIIIPSSAFCAACYGGVEIELHVNYHRYRNQEAASRAPSKSGSVQACCSVTSVKLPLPLFRYGLFSPNRYRRDFHSHRCCNPRHKQPNPTCTCQAGRRRHIREGAIAIIFVEAISRIRGALEAHSAQNKMSNQPSLSKSKNAHPHPGASRK